jgi:hypothetical protein
MSPKNEQKGLGEWAPKQRIRFAEQRLRERTVKCATWKGGKPKDPEWKDRCGQELLEQPTHQKLEWRDRDEITDLTVWLLRERGPSLDEKNKRELIRVVRHRN